MTRLGELAERRAALRASAARERTLIALELEPLAKIGKVVDAGWSVALWLRERPLVGAALTGFALVALKRRGVGLIRLALGAWQAWRWLNAAR